MTTVESRYVLPPLPYSEAALEPHISRETVHFHYDIHHRNYVNKLNALIANSEYTDSSLEEIVMSSTGDIFNNAGQIWNHNFYWQCLSPNGGGAPGGELAIALSEKYGSVADFQAAFSKVAETLFGSGWAWLIQEPDGALNVIHTGNAGCPIRSGHRPLLVCDVWEHAYYIDYRNRRPEYVKGFWQLVNWKFAESRYRKPGASTA